jgi:hypothetical protein
MMFADRDDVDPDFIRENGLIDHRSDRLRVTHDIAAIVHGDLAKGVYAKLKGIELLIHCMFLGLPPRFARMPFPPESDLPSSVPHH